MAEQELAQVNVARLVAPLGDPAVADFVTGLEPVNALADAAPGFVWRLQTETGDATDVRVGDDPLVIVNLSVWTGLDPLREFVFRSDHAGFLRRRREWFSPWEGPPAALWWVPAGHRPDVDEALDRLRRLADDGPTADAFTFRSPFPPPG
ncbi:DUF3291 domain-containing protein [Kineosporia sp. A_224]|uniref:DUF3291 domain-containing protein n=1 Tax=Kineosporia sp. A_224 TaxID=1962180 RepID=UPI000B4B5E7A|nr:DUF3291 domain-containing protein [Kineosporia sp. A_224]